MTIEEVREFAGAHGILSLRKFTDKEELVRTIQLAMDGEPCFGSSLTCSNYFCEWKDDCPGYKSNAEDEACPA
jgi:hypothetical protein